MRHVSTSSRQRQSPHERHLPWQRLLFPQDFTRTFHLYDFSIHIVDPAHPNFRIPRYVSDAAASLGFFFFFLFLFFFLYLVRFLTIQFIVVRSFLLRRDSRRKKKFEFRENSDFSLITKTRWGGLVG